ncbi:hypothetical protein E4U54_004586 [Claviceps lovelessii]|nr:hypothetical protein E4U54_004586 [Claviceps lovelessii]
MSGFKEVMKNGWHPEKPGTTFRGSVSGLIGRNKDSSPDYSNHVSRPLSDLKDPSSFAPPPRRTGPGLTPAAPPSVSSKGNVVSSPSHYKSSRGDSTELPPRKSTASHDTEASSPPVSQEEEQSQRPPLPHRANTTGLSTQHLPRPPARRDGADGRSPPSYSETSGTTVASKAAAAPPSLPPRLPPRGATSSPSRNEKGNGLLNGASINKLGLAGVSVPALGIGRGGAAMSGSSGPPSAAPGGAVAAQPSALPGSGLGKWGSQVNDLQGRFTKMKSPSATTSAQEPPPQGTTWAQKQAALKTASDFHKNPSSISFSDAKAAAATANNFRQRHGEQVASGVKTANNLNQKYGLMDKVSSAYADAESSSHASSLQTSSAALSSIAGKKKPPPPPPPKKKPGLANPALAAYQDGSSPPPPVPMSTRPAF